MASRTVVRWSWAYLPRCVRVYISRCVFTVFWCDRCNRVYAGRLARFRTEGFEAQKAEVMASVWEGPMKRKTLEMLKGVKLHADPGGGLDQYPHMAEFMTSALFESENGMDRRESPTLTIWCAGGQWKASIKDRAEGLVMWLSAETWQQLLQMIDLFVLEPDAPWRHDEGEQKGKRTRD